MVPVLTQTSWSRLVRPLTGRAAVWLGRLGRVGGMSLREAEEVQTRPYAVQEEGPIADVWWLKREMERARRAAGLAGVGRRLRESRTPGRMIPSSEQDHRHLISQTQPDTHPNQLSTIYPSDTRIVMEDHPSVSQDRVPSPVLLRRPAESLVWRPVSSS